MSRRWCHRIITAISSFLHDPDLVVSSSVHGTCGRHAPLDVQDDDGNTPLHLCRGPLEASRQARTSTRACTRLRACICSSSTAARIP
eukprot:2025922-Pleurochrysis_carterae.AAC.2